MSAKWNAATRYSAHPFTTKTGARVHFFCLNYPRIRGWYQARVHPFSSGNGKGDSYPVYVNNVNRSQREVDSSRLGTSPVVGIFTRTSDALLTAFCTSSWHRGAHLSLLSHESHMWKAHVLWGYIVTMFYCPITYGSINIFSKIKSHQQVELHHTYTYAIVCINKYHMYVYIYTCSRNVNWQARTDSSNHPVSNLWEYESMIQNPHL